ncbi:DEAD/DEAH box helicase [Streptomyces sp. NPDC004684]
MRDPSSGWGITDIERHLAGERERRTHWPDPKLALNPTFRSGGTVASLCDDGPLHPMCREYFRHKKHPNDPGSRTLSLHLHQREAITVADREGPYVLTTGTGPGKSLTYIVPIVDKALRHLNPDGMSAIVVHPMNALANSQLHELKKYLMWGVPEDRRKVTFARYTGQEDSEQNSRCCGTSRISCSPTGVPPHPPRRTAGADQRRSWPELSCPRRAAHLPRVPGSRLALLVHQLRDACEAPALQRIGASATVATGVTFAEARKEIAKAATRLFGTKIGLERVIGESLERSTAQAPTPCPESTPASPSPTRSAGPPPHTRAPVRL